MAISDREEYRPITNYEGYYEVSNYGNVKSIDRYVNNPHKSTSLKEEKYYQKVILKKQDIFL